MRGTFTVSVIQEPDDLIRECLASGRDASASDVVRAAMRQLERDEATARNAIRSSRPESETTRA